MIDLVRHLQPVRARESFKQRRDVITKLAIADPAPLQNVTGQNVKIKLRRYPQMSAIGQNCLDQPRMIENGIARFDVAQKIDQGNVVSLRARESAHDEVEVSRGEARPTIRPDHRGIIMRDGDVYGKPDRISPTPVPLAEEL